MTLQGVIFLWVLNILILLWVFNLSRQRKLSVGYAVVWVFWTVLGLLVVSVPPLLDLVTRAVGAIFPASALSVLAFGFLFVMQVYVLSQLSILSRRLTLLAQEHSIEHSVAQGSDS